MKTYHNNRKYNTGYYELKNPNKYLGTDKPYYKSGFEYRMMYWCDLNINVIEWNYEPFPIDYIFQVPATAPKWMKELVDFKKHRYYMDFYAKIREDNGNVQRYMLEIKPDVQTSQPVEPKKKTKKAVANFMLNMKEYIKNCNKWTAAEQFCNQKGYIFKVLTENNLYT